VLDLRNSVKFTRGSSKLIMVAGVFAFGTGGPARAQGETPIADAPSGESVPVGRLNFDRQTVVVCDAPLPLSRTVDMVTAANEDKTAIYSFPCLVPTKVHVVLPNGSRTLYDLDRQVVPNAQGKLGDIAFPDLPQGQVGQCMLYVKFRDVRGLGNARTPSWVNPGWSPVLLFGGREVPGQGTLDTMNFQLNAADYRLLAQTGPEFATISWRNQYKARFLETDNLVLIGTFDRFVGEVTNRIRAQVPNAGAPEYVLFAGGGIEQCRQLIAQYEGFQVLELYGTSPLDLIREVLGEQALNVWCKDVWDNNATARSVVAFVIDGTVQVTGLVSKLKAFGAQVAAVNENQWLNYRDQQKKRDIEVDSEVDVATIDVQVNAAQNVAVTEETKEKVLEFFRNNFSRDGSMKVGGDFALVIPTTVNQAAFNDWKNQFARVLRQGRIARGHATFRGSVTLDPGAVEVPSPQAVFFPTTTGFSCDPGEPLVTASFRRLQANSRVRITLKMACETRMPRPHVTFQLRAGEAVVDWTENHMSEHEKNFQFSKTVDVRVPDSGSLEVQWLLAALTGKNDNDQWVPSSMDCASPKSATPWLLPLNTRVIMGREQGAAGMLLVEPLSE